MYKVDDKQIIQCNIRDNTDKKIVDEKIIKANRLYSFISHINQMIVHVKDLETLFNETCKIAVEQGKYKMVWIGTLDENSKLNIISVNGDVNASKEIQKYSGMDFYSIELRDTPTGKVLTTGTYAVSNDVQNDPALKVWKEEYVRHEIKANITLPIKKSGKVIGIIGFNSTTENFFDAEEIKLLNEAANDISFALELFEKEKQRTQTEQNLFKSEARLKEAQAIAHTSNWEIDLNTNISTWSDELYHMYGINKAEVQPSTELFLSFMHPDDADDAKQNVKESFANLKNSSYNFRFIRKDGMIRYGYTERKFEFDKNNKPVRVFGIVQDVTERKLAEEKLEQQNKELLKTNTELDQFVYSTSHDLRAPLTSVIGLIDLLETERQSENTTELLNLMKNCLTKADDTIKEIIDYSRNSRFEIRKEKIEIENHVEETFKSIALFDLNKRIDKQIVINKSVEFYSDKLRLKIILSNIMFNAIKYSKPDSNIVAIKVTIDISPQRALISIIDNGIGIEPKQIAKIFEMFHRATELSTGSGLGLYITKECVEKLNGTIEVESEFNTGTVFTLNIPNLINT